MLSISQNFIKDKKLISTIIKNSTDIGANDLVLDIGAGKGGLTIPLALVAAKVMAVELDLKLVGILQRNITEANLTNVSVINADFLDLDLNRLGSYKVFANIPFSLSADIIRKLLLGYNKPLSCYLFLEKNTAYRFMGLPQSDESLISLMIKLNFHMKLIHQFHPYDFQPMPKADVVLVRFVKKEEVFPPDQQLLFQTFMEQIFLSRKHDLKGALLTIFTYKQLQRIKKDLGLNIRIRPSQLSFDDWVKIFSVAQKLLPISN
jgi:16S rRNA A1518/A1519 N6-dimethyltransferase RsmA/KsgA/DIM1 with predicted DNA glycosylase/AP lyase activity